MFDVVRECGALARVLPEVEHALSSAPGAQRLGSRLDIASRHYSAAVQFASLAFDLESGAIEALCARANVPTECRDVALLAAGRTDEARAAYDMAIHEKISSSESGEAGEDVTDEDEELVEKCLEIIRQEKRASTSLLQRRLRLGYTRAARIVDILEQRGILGPGEGAKPREILVDLDAAV